MVEPLPDMLLLFKEHFIYTHTSQVDSSCLFIETLDNPLRLVAPFFPNCTNTGDALSMDVLVDGLQLDIVTLNEGRLTYALA